MIIIAENSCEVCGACVSVCPVEAIVISRDAAIIDNERCIECGNCIVVCPVEAVYEEK